MLIYMVGAAGIEPATPTMSTKGTPGNPLKSLDQATPAGALFAPMFPVCPRPQVQLNLRTLR